MGFHYLGVKLAFGSKNHLWSHVLSLLNLILFGHIYPKNNVANKMTKLQYIFAIAIFLFRDIRQKKTSA